MHESLSKRKLMLILIVVINMIINIIIMALNYTYNFQLPGLDSTVLSVLVTLTVALKVAPELLDDWHYRSNHGRTLHAL